MTDHLDESIIIGTLAISGSDAINLKNFSIASSESSKPSSIFMSIIWAPFCTCCLATDMADSKSPSFINLLNFAEPVTLVRSPTFMKLLSGLITKGSSPLRRVYPFNEGIFLGF